MELKNNKVLDQNIPKAKKKFKVKIKKLHTTLLTQTRFLIKSKPRTNRRIYKLNKKKVAHNILKQRSKWKANLLYNFNNFTHGRFDENLKRPTNSIMYHLIRTISAYRRKNLIKARIIFKKKLLKQLKWSFTKLEKYNNHPILELAQKARKKLSLNISYIAPIRMHTLFINTGKKMVLMNKYSNNKNNPTKYVTTFIKLRRQKAVTYSTKTQKTLLLRGLFSFNDSNMIVNNLLTQRYILNTGLLKFSQPLLSRRALPVTNPAEHNNFFYLNHLNAINLKMHQRKASTNNFYPLFYFSSNITYNNTTLLSRLYFSNIGSLVSNKYKNFYTFFLLNFLERFLHRKVWLRADSRDFFPTKLKRYIKSIVYLNNNLYGRFNKLISIKELTEIIIIMFSTRDLQIFLYFIKHCFEKSHFKKHKKILSILFNIIKKNKCMLDRCGLKGFFFDIRGKVGVSGNAKKRHLSFSIAKTTQSSQNFKSYFQQIHVWTPTGQMGITCYILF
jgi:hypothetical protein